MVQAMSLFNQLLQPSINRRRGSPAGGPIVPRALADPPPPSQTAGQPSQIEKINLSLSFHPFTSIPKPSPNMSPC